MATKIRLQRGGRKSYAFYSIVIADVRAPRDGKFTEKIGTFNPNTNPATVDLNFDRALYWVGRMARMLRLLLFARTRLRQRRMLLLRSSRLRRK